MLPSSSSSQLPSYGTINQYKRFSWSMQSQIEKQADLNATTLSLGIASSQGNIPSSMMKESKPTQMMKESKQWNISSSRAEIVSANRVLAMAAEAPASLNYCASADSPLCSYLMMNGVPAPSLSLAMQCENALKCDPNFGIPNWAVTISPYQYGQASEQTCKGDHGVNLFLHPELFTPSNLRSPNDSIADCESSVSSTAQNSKGRQPAVWEPNLAIENPLNDLDLPIACTGVQEHPCNVQSDKPAMVIGRDDPAGSSKNLLSSSYEGFRTCTVCGTSKTPLWRSGPTGPKSLCNACGIRMKKSKRLQAEVDAGAAAASPVAKVFKRCASSSKVMGARTLPLKRKLSMEAAVIINGEPMNQKKTRKAVPRRAMIWAPPNLANSTGGHKNIDGWAKLAAGLVVSTSPTAKRSYRREVLAKVDELEEAAVLLMALSRGLSLS